MGTITSNRLALLVTHRYTAKTSLRYRYILKLIRRCRYSLHVTSLHLSITLNITNYDGTELNLKNARETKYSYDQII